MKNQTFKNAFHILLIYTFLLLLNSSCTSTNSKKSEDFFSIKKELFSEVIIKSDSLKDPWDLCIKDTFLIVGNFKADPLLEIYGLSGKCYKKTLHIGRGPSEILYIGQIQSNLSDDLFYVYDVLGRKLLEYDIKSLLNKEIYSPKNYFDLVKNSKADVVINKILTAKDYLICDNKTPEGRILLMKKDGTPIDYFLNFPGKVLPEISDIDNASLFGSYLTVNPQNDHLAMATSMAKMIDIFKLQPNSIDSVWAFYESMPNDVTIQGGDGYSQAFFTPKSKISYLDVASSKKYVYALYSGLTLNDPNCEYGNVIKVISWDGNETFEIKTDKVLKSIEVDTDDLYLYGVSLNEEKGAEIVKFKL
jgi:hypothetical protein